MKKMLCSLLTVLLLVSCFAGTVNAAERAMGKFDVTVKAGELKPAKTGFPMAAGETVTINATYSPSSADVRPYRLRRRFRQIRRRRQNKPSNRQDGTP